MTIYYINYFSIFIYMLAFNYFRKTRLKKIIYHIYILQMILLLSLRHRTVGNDMINYYSTFLSSGLDNYWSHKKLEIGYKLINYLIFKLFGNFQVLIVVMAMLTICPVAYFIYKRSKNPMMSLVIYMSFNYYYYTFITFRQSTAYGIILLSYKYIEEKKLFKFILCVLLAASFHKSALICLPIYWLFDIRIKNKSLLLGLFTAIVLYIFRVNIAKFILKYFYSDYILQISNSVTFLFFNLFIFLLCYKFRTKKIILDKAYNKYFMSFFIGVVLMVETTVFSNMLRITNYFTIILTVLLSNILRDLKLGKLRIFIHPAIYTMLALLYLSFLQGGIKQMMEYKFFWQ